MTYPTQTVIIDRIKIKIAKLTAELASMDEEEKDSRDWHHSYFNEHHVRKGQKKKQLQEFESLLKPDHEW